MGVQPKLSVGEPLNLHTNTGEHAVKARRENKTQFKRKQQDFEEMFYFSVSSVLSTIKA